MKKWFKNLKPKTRLITVWVLWLLTVASMVLIAVFHENYHSVAIIFTYAFLLLLVFAILFNKWNNACKDKINLTEGWPIKDEESFINKNFTIGSVINKKVYLIWVYASIVIICLSITGDIILASHVLNFAMFMYVSFLPFFSIGAIVILMTFYLIMLLCGKKVKYKNKCIVYQDKSYSVEDLEKCIYEWHKYGAETYFEIYFKNGNKNVKIDYFIPYKIKRFNKVFAIINKE